MGPSRIVLFAIVALSFSKHGLCAGRGEVATVDEPSGKIGVKLSGTVGSGDTTAPTTFKV